jgi:hypothetical protein
VGTVAEAMASLAFKRDRVNVLRSARKTVEAELPEWQADAVAADVEVERLISQIIADYVQVLVSEASELARRLGPYRAALMEFVKEHGDSPRAWDAQDSFRKSRAPLNETADQAWAFFRELRECDAAPINPWRSARERLRENPNASLLRELVAEHAGLLADPDDARPQPA